MPASSASRYFDPDKLRAARTDARLSQRELGERLGVSASQIGKWEGGFHKPYPRHLQALGEALGVPPDLLTNTRASQTGGPRDLGHLRISAGLTQEEAASRADLLRTHYSRIERGEIVALPDEIAQRIADALNARIEEVRTAHAQARAGYLRKSMGSRT